jgi:hypothetical protein
MGLEGLPERASHVVLPFDRITGLAVARQAVTIQYRYRYQSEVAYTEHEKRHRLVAFPSAVVIFYETDGAAFDRAAARISAALGVPLVDLQAALAAAGIEGPPA